MLGVTHLVEQLESIDLFDTTNISLHRILQDEAEAIEITNQIKLLDRLIDQIREHNLIGSEKHIQLVNLMKSEILTP
jgi:hypothetical protein